MELDRVDLTTLRFSFDTAALVLIWLVQLVIYPAFLHFRMNEFLIWHPRYTRRVTFVVMPIMLGQLGVYLYSSLIDASWGIWLNLTLILGAWAITFFRAIPLHSALDESSDHRSLSAKLIAVNWWRTLLWSIVWLLSLLVVLGVVPN